MSSIDLNLRRNAWLFDLLIRAMGILLLGCATLSIATLVRFTGGRPHESTLAELLLAACGFLGASAGMMALTTGRGLFERITVPASSHCRTPA